MNLARFHAPCPSRAGRLARTLGLAMFTLLVITPAVLALSLVAPARAADAPEREDDAATEVGTPRADGFEPEWREHQRETAELRARFAREGHPRPALVSPQRVAGIAATPPNALVNSKLGDGFGSAQVEPTIAAFGPYTLCAFNTDKMPSGGDGITAAFQAGPGSGLWTPAPLPPVIGPMSKWIADPVVTVNQKTMTWTFSGLFTPMPGSGIDGIAVVKGMFLPGGPSGATLTWAPPTVVRMGAPGSVLFDKEWIAADSSSGKLYLTYMTFGTGTDTVQFQASADGGTSWSPPFAIAACTPALYQGPRVAVGPDGEVYVAWFRAAGPPDSMLIRKSIDHGASFGARTTVATVYSNFGSGAPGSNLTYAPNFPALAVDRSFGDHRGRVYVAWAEAENYSDDPIGTGGAMVEAAPSGSIFHATPFTPGMVVRGVLAGADADTWSFFADAGKTYSFLVDSIPAGIVSLGVLCVDSTVTYAQSSVPTGIASGKPNLTLFTPSASGMYFVKLVHTSTSVLGYRMKTGVTMVTMADMAHGYDQRDVRVAWSDGGSSWSSARMNVDPPKSDQVMPEIGVSTEGYVYGSWLDYSMPGGPMCDPVSNIAAGRSTDGGASWAASLPVTSASTSWWMTPSDIAPNQGDYIGLSVGEQVAFAYPDGRLGDPDIFASGLFLYPGIGCVPDSAWNAGSSHTLTYSIYNPNALFANDYDYTLTAERDWPGFPITGTVSVGPASSSGAIPISFTIPDSAAHGMMAMTFKVELPNGALSASCASTDTITGATTAVGPGAGAPRLALGSAWPNPARGVLHVAFSLAGGAPASLELIDLAGRRVLERAVGGMGVGPHVLTLDREAAALPVGIYALRLTQAGRSLSTKVALLR